METKRGFIIYFDILGYKNVLLNNTKEENDKIADILNRFSEFYLNANIALHFGNKFDKSKLFIRAFSDNFLVLYELEENDYMGLATLQLVATRIQYQFLHVGLLTRGSISFGEIQYNDLIVFGVDLIHAVELEEGHRMPSIVVDHALVEVFEGKEIPYKEEVALFDVWPHSSLDYQDCLDGITQFLYYMNKSHVDDTVLEKIKWVIKKLNDYFSKDQKKFYTLTVDYHLEERR